MNILIDAALVAAVALGAWIAMGEGMVLSFIPRLLSRAPAWVRKPVCDCPRCMVSVWGAVTLGVTGHWPEGALWGIPAFLITIAAATGIQETLHRP